jgi:hypothetical protein
MGAPSALLERRGRRRERAVGVAIYQSQEKKRVPVRMAWQLALRDADVQRCSACRPTTTASTRRAIAHVGAALLALVDRADRLRSRVARVQFQCSAVSYSAVPVYAPTGATGYILSEAVRYGGPADWRVDYVEFVLTRPPSRPLYDADGAVSKQRASPPTVFTFHALPEAERKSARALRPPPPHAARLHVCAGFADDVRAAERRIALRNIFFLSRRRRPRCSAPSPHPTPAPPSRTPPRLATDSRRRTTLGARVTLTAEGRVGDKFMTFRNTMRWWVDYRAHRWSMIAHAINYPARRLTVEPPKYDDRIGS